MFADFILALAFAITAPDGFETQNETLLTQERTAGSRQRITDIPNDKTTQPRTAQPNVPSTTKQSRDAVVSGRQFTSQRNSLINYNRLSSTPYMIGDTTAGGCGALQLGGVNTLTLAHPTYACSRLNIAENNSPVVSNRIYANYRHFNNASTVDIFSFFPNGGRNDLDIDTWTLGIERKVTDDCSCEVRLPVNRQLTSQVDINVTSNLTELPLTDYETSIGNLGLVYKYAFYRDETLYSSCGISMNLPTAQDVQVRFRLDDNNFQNRAPNGAPLGPPFPFRIDNVSRLSNDTVNLIPYLSAIYSPTSSWYTIGFMQLDVPLNQSRIDVAGTTFIANQPVVAYDQQGKIRQQLILRTNIGLGKWLWKSRSDRIVSTCGITSELHYSTTLNDADVFGPLLVVPDLGLGPQLLRAGNIANRTDSLNATFGGNATIGETILTHGVTVPFRSGTDRGFDFEYIASINRRY